MLTTVDAKLAEAEYSPPEQALPERATPADYFLSVMVDHSASPKRRDAAARALAALGEAAVRKAWLRREGMELDAIEATLSAEEWEQVRAPLSAEEAEREPGRCKPRQEPASPAQVQAKPPLSYPTVAGPAPRDAAAPFTRRR